MRKHFLWLIALVLTWPTLAAERRFNFAEFPLNQTPTGFLSTVAGEGKPGDWRTMLDEVPSSFQTLTPKAQEVSKRAVLAQLSKDATDEHFPMLVFDSDETYSDFTLTTRFKLVSGVAEQMAGVAFRIQDEKNFYVIRASGLGNNLRFYKMVNGMRSAPIGAEVEITKGVWHELEVRCQGNQIRCRLDGKELFPPLKDNSFSAGRIGFWTKSDSVSYFADTQLTYTPREPLAQAMAREVMKEYPKLHGIKIYAPGGNQHSLRVIASNNEKNLGQPGTGVEQKVFDKGDIYQAKRRGEVTVVMPLRDRNGDVVAAVHLVMDTFLGQTEQNVLSRALPIIKYMQRRVLLAKDLNQ